MVSLTSLSPRFQVRRGENQHQHPSPPPAVCLFRLWASSFRKGGSSKQACRIVEPRAGCQSPSVLSVHARLEACNKSPRIGPLLGHHTSLTPLRGSGGALVSNPARGLVPNRQCKELSHPVRVTETARPSLLRSSVARQAREPCWNGQWPPVRLPRK